MIKFYLSKLPFINLRAFWNTKVLLFLKKDIKVHQKADKNPHSAKLQPQRMQKNSEYW